ncbi:translocation protein SEC62 isoform X2 [Hyposmocoma kahamanoa]|uniref:translocation protein SEC62 isoform X2 n=1 Tax=Hyposmocoma kahamanoa TaxID=1477025 RepID=UPI000E6D7978|nr:translocation protein SEC62 isoform X2 [Hyposmocoma kahamanoa]
MPKEKYFEFEESEESEKPTNEEYAVAKWLKSNVPTKKTKFLNHHVEYFTGTKAVDALLTSKWATGKNRIFKTRQEVTDFLHSMLLHKLFHRAKKVPVSEQELKGKSKKKELEKGKSGDEKDGDKGQGSACESKADSKEDKKEAERKKRKIRLEMHMEQLFLDTNDAYVWIYDPMPWYYWVCGTLVVFGTITVCMFPLWPATVRKGVYYLSIAAAAFLVMIIALTVLRVVIFCLVWILTVSRHHLWLLPNLTEDVGFFASFWPLYKYEYRGPGSESDKASKNKKKRKKDKHSDEEADEKAPLIEKKPAEAELEARADEATDKSELELLVEPDTEDINSRDDTSTPPAKKNSESESENSQRSSTDRDFEIVDAGDLEPDDNTT